MRTKFLALLCLLISFNSIAQKKKDKNTDNFSYVKLLITNAEGKVLLLKWDNDWELPGARYNQPYSLTKFIDTLAQEDGIRVKDIAINAIISYQYEGQSKFAIMQYYTASYSSGSQRVPAGCSDIRWIPKDEALKMMTFEDQRMIVEKIYEDPKTVWAGTFYKYRDPLTKLARVQLKDLFYKMK
ncbi:MAG: hypothetical protein K0Q95_2233 [Bacteroidota bacterium]|jgi:hypothetical protein|nr:hypothetical protein [Bacteroidota bacterium]